ncbi:hypothetical protein BV20DRAFT_964843 [Pilatotrama ljubarskyi]|nr:hypothetical protein BV20DRAFT_964843 [Pilatotrama ljubarskyi]
MPNRLMYDPVAGTLASDLREVAEPIVLPNAQGLAVRMGVDMDIVDQRADDHEDIRVVARNHLREDVRADLRKDVHADFRENVRADFRDDLRADLREDVRADLGEDVRADFREDVRADFREDVRLDLRGDIREDIRANTRANMSKRVRVDADADIRDLKDIHTRTLSGVRAEEISGEPCTDSRSGHQAGPRYVRSGDNPFAEQNVSSAPSAWAAKGSADEHRGVRAGLSGQADARADPEVTAQSNIRVDPASPADMHVSRRAEGQMSVHAELGRTADRTDIHAEQRVEGQTTALAESHNGTQVRLRADAHPETQANAHVDLRDAGASALPDPGPNANAEADAAPGSRLAEAPLLLAREPGPLAVSSASSSRTYSAGSSRVEPRDDAHRIEAGRDHLHGGRPLEHAGPSAGNGSGQGAAEERQIDPALQGGTAHSGHGIHPDPRGYGQQYYAANWSHSGPPYGYNGAAFAGPAQGYHHAGAAYAPVPPPGAYTGYPMANMYPPMGPGYQQPFLAPSQPSQAHPHPPGYAQAPPASPYNAPIPLYPPPGIPYGFAPNGPQRAVPGRDGEQHSDAQQSQASGPGGLPPPS